MTFSSEPQLTHYGVKGMRWGVRKNPARAYARANKKLGKLRNKAARANVSAAGYQQLADRKRFDASLAKKMKDKTSYKENKSLAKQADRLAAKNRSKAARALAKANKWMAAMDSTFDKTTLSQLSKDDIRRGREFYEKYLNR